MHQKLTNSHHKILVDLGGKVLVLQRVLDSRSKLVPRRNEKFFEHPEFWKISYIWLYKRKMFCQP